MSEQLQAIGRRVAELREIAGVPAASFARRIGVDEERYLAYERGEEDIPVGVLMQVADAFGVELTALLTGDDPRLHTFAVSRAGEGVRVDRRADYDYEALAFNFANKKCEPFLVTVDPDVGDPTMNRHPGQEFNYVLEGRMRIIIGGHELELGTGDSIYFDATQPHAMLALDGRPARFLAVIA